MRKLGLLLAVAVFALAASAIPMLPEAYRGLAYVDGSAAPKGTEIKVVSASGAEFSTTVINDGGLYALDVMFDDVETANILEGVGDGEALTWYVNNIPAYQPAAGSDVANIGAVNTNFNILAGSHSQSCSDGVRNNGEDGVDCGGPCASCGKNKGKATTTVKQTTTVKATTTIKSILDRLSGGGGATTTVAGKTTETTLDSSTGTPKPGKSPAQTALPASCSDGVRNNGEDGVDCGGACGQCGGAASNTKLLIAAGGIGLLLIMFFAALVVLLVFLRHRKGGSN